VIDDGQGLDADLILAKALNLNIAQPDQQYSESEIFKFIFAPGFSTQKEVNKISGRGVGMNVVEDVVAKMRGKIDIRSQKGHGSTFSIKIPMNLSVLNGIIVKIHEERYIVPTVVINEIITPEKEQWIRVNNKIVGVHIRDNIFPIIDPYHMLGYGEGPSIDSFDCLVVLEHDGRFIGLPVEAITGRQEIVSKKLGSQFKQLSYAAGASILGDGKVSVILDVDALFSMKLANPSSLPGKTELI
jgi:two-component system chemotaxis sensor kinase CheA